MERLILELVYLSFYLSGCLWKKKLENSCEAAGQISESNQNMSQLFCIQLANWVVPWHNG